MLIAISADFVGCYSETDASRSISVGGLVGVPVKSGRPGAARKYTINSGQALLEGVSFLPLSSRDIAGFASSMAGAQDCR